MRGIVTEAREKVKRPSSIPTPALFFLLPREKEEEGVRGVE